MTSTLSSVPDYQPGDLSRLLFPSAPPPPIGENGKPDPSFFGYLKPTKGRPPSRKAPKGGGKFSQQHLHDKIKSKKQLAQEVRAKHEAKVVEDRERKAAEKKARSDSGRPKVSPLPAPDREADEDEDEEDDDGVDTDNSEIGDEIDEDAIEEFMRDIEAEDSNGMKEDLSEDDDDGDESSKDPNAIAAQARLERKAKKEKRLAEDAEMEAPAPKKKDIKKQRAEDAEMEAPAPKKKDIKKQRAENIANDPRLPRTIFVGNVPVALKSSKLIRWVEGHLGIDASVQQTIVESVRYRSVAVADPKLPKKVAVQKGLFHQDRDSLNAYIVFKEEQYVPQAIEKCHGQPIELDGKTWHLRVDKVTSPKDPDAKKHANAHTIFCGNLPFSINENDLYEHFESCGEIQDVRVVRDRDSQMGKGIAFITFKDDQSMRNALASHKTKFRERTLRIMKAVENKKLHKTTPSEPKSQSNKKGQKPGQPKEGYGGAHKVKELNRAGVLKKPRHVPRNGQPTPSTPVNVVGPSGAKVTGTKRTFEGEHADPTEHIKKQKREDFKQREKKEKRKDAKKLTPAGKK